MGSDSSLRERELLTLAAAAEDGSEHPLGRAVTAAARDRGLHLPPADQFASVPGRGVRAHVAGHLVQIGSPAHLLPETAPGAGPAHALTAELKTAGTPRS
ncbi:hypothetical protein ACGFIJ_33190 [Microbispora bryophytorum]|uniref:hypothetical protein n=1 Tax=Microbispora bryophytorum TaxID=1460882 RepID=UPI00372058A0